MLHTKKKVLLLSFILAAAVALTLFLVLPRERRTKFGKQLSIPYQTLYMSLVNFEEILQPHREEMKRFYNNGTQHGAEVYIAHGGGIGGFVYTNSKEALEDSIAKGFKFIEIDLLETEDGDIIGAYNWRKFAKLTGQNDSFNFRKKSLKELKELKINGKYSILSSDDIREAMENNPELILVTDKISNFDLLLKKIPYPDRMIVEVFSKYDYMRALEAGIKYPAYSINKEQTLDDVEKYEFPIVILLATKMQESDNAARIAHLHQKGITFFVHHGEICDTPEFINTHLGKNISAIYTDKWSPSAPSPIVTAH